MATKRQRLTDWWLGRPRVDYSVALLGLLTGARGLGITDQVALVGAVAGVAGGLLGMTAVVMGLYAANEALSKLQANHGETIGRNWSSILFGFGIAGVIAMLSPLIPWGCFSGAVLGYALALTALCMFRLSWFLKTYFAVAKRPESAQERDRLNW